MKIKKYRLILLTASILLITLSLSILFINESVYFKVGPLMWILAFVIALSFLLNPNLNIDTTSLIAFKKSKLYSMRSIVIVFVFAISFILFNLVSAKPESGEPVYYLFKVSPVLIIGSCISTDKLMTKSSQ